jgi:myosin heavy subunit
LTCQRLEEALVEERADGRRTVDEERMKCASQISELVEKHRNQIAELNSKQHELERRLLEENEADKNFLAKQNEEKLLTLKVEFQKLQKTHEESLDILREENEAIREQIDEKNVQIEEVKHESRKLKDDYEAKEMKLKEQVQIVRSDNHKLRHELSKIEEKVGVVHEENARLREENDRLLSYSNIKDKGISIQELQSLRVVLELKQNEVGELRRALAEANQKNETLAAAEERSAALSARCEDLQLQLQRKSELEQALIAENKKLSDSVKEEINQNKRLCQHNEELKWKLNQNKEIVSKVLEQAAEETNFNRSMLSSSFNERHLCNKQNLERTLSFREQKNSNDRSWKSKNDDLSPPSSPKVKGVVEKSDSVSYVLDLDESPEIVASRIVRRSFRNSTPPKTTPTKSPSNKRPRMKFPLSLSASASAILPSNKSEYSRSRSLSNRNGDFDGDGPWATSTPERHDDDLDLDEDEDDLKLPALPSEIGRKNGAQALPSPKHLAGEAMISESNSEDESTSSSSVQL